MAIAQVIPTRSPFLELSVEPQVRLTPSQAALQAIGGIREGVRSAAVQFGQHALLQVAGEQQGSRGPSICHGGF
ncbi:hypothetical protein D3C80_1650970 [compost metagenome]